MKLKDIVEDCVEIQEFLQEVTGKKEKIEMGIRFKNLKLSYIMPKVYEKNIDRSAKKMFKKENGLYVVQGLGDNCIDDLKSKLFEFEKLLIKNTSKKGGA